MSEPRITGRAPIKMVEAYWEGLRNGRLMPNRGEVQARGLGAAMDNAFILERVANGFARLRVAGGRLNEMMGMETRGMPVSAFFQKEAYRGLSDSLEAVFGEPAIVQLRLIAPSTVGRSEMTGELMLFPLRSDLGDVTRALGCLIYDGQLGTPPCRFLIDAEDRRTLTGFADAPPKAAPLRVHEVSGFSEDATAFDAPRPHRSGERPHLRLVKTDED